MNGRCKDCRFWQLIPDRGEGKCTQGFFDEYLNSGDLVPDRAGVMIDYYAPVAEIGVDGFYTGPEFGCVHFEAHE